MTFEAPRGTPHAGCSKGCQGCGDIARKLDRCRYDEEGRHLCAWCFERQKAKPDCFANYPKLSPAAKTVLESMQGRAVRESAMREIEERLEKLSDRLLLIVASPDTDKLAKEFADIHEEIRRLDRRYLELKEGATDGPHA